MDFKIAFMNMVNDFRTSMNKFLNEVYETERRTKKNSSRHKSRY